MFAALAPGSPLMISMAGAAGLYRLLGQRFERYMGLFAADSSTSTYAAAVQRRDRTFQITVMQQHRRFWLFIRP